jgi:adenosylcobyric acid synthase
LPVRTIMSETKTVRRATGVTDWNARAFCGYEIHMGETVYEPGSQSFSDITRDGDSDSTRDGASTSEGRVFGTYVHGLFDDDAFRHTFIERARQTAGLTPAAEKIGVTAQRQQRMNRWANHLRASLNLELIRGWIK